MLLIAHLIRIIKWYKSLKQNPMYMCIENTSPNQKLLFEKHQMKEKIFNHDECLIVKIKMLYVPT